MRTIAKQKKKASMSHTAVLTTSALLVAMSVILGWFKVPVTNLIEIRFQMLPIAVGGMLFGPAVGGVMGAMEDVLSYIVRPTGPFFPGFSISAAVGGVIFGLMLREKPTVLRIFLTEAVYTAVVSICLNNIWLSILYGNAFLPVMIARLPQSLIMIPVNTVLLTAVLRTVGKIPFVRSRA